jgi:AraC-like DNA-binding protein
MPGQEKIPGWTNGQRSIAISLDTFRLKASRFGLKDRAMNRISTSSLPQDRRWQAWREVICDTFPPVDVLENERDDFYGHIEARSYADLSLIRIRSHAQRVQRRRHHISASREDYLQINFQISGSCHMEQDGRSAMLRTGDLAIYESCRPYDLGFTNDFEQISLMLPRALIRQRFGPIEAFTARPINGKQGSGRFAFAFVQALAGQLDEAEDGGPMSTRIRDHLLDLLITALTPMAGSGAAALSAGRSSNLHRVKSFILENLRDPDLSPMAIAQANKVSLRHIYGLFQNEGETLSRWILSARLDRCRKDLENPAMNGRTLGEIAFAWGFIDNAHFSRAFKARFGITPRDCRAQVRAEGANWATKLRAS